LEQAHKGQQATGHFLVISQEALRYIEKKLDKFELKNKLPRIKSILETLSLSKHPTEESIKLALEDFDYIQDILDSMPPPIDFPPHPQK